MQQDRVIQNTDIAGSIQKTANNIMAARADMDPQLYDTLILQKGYRIVWEQGMFCSCLDTHSGQPDYNCVACLGKGYIYFDPTEIRAVVTSISGNKDQNNRIGLDEIGTAYLTPSSIHKVGFRDRFTFLDFVIKFSEIIRGDNSLSHKLRYPAKSIITVRVLGKEYYEGEHFSVSEDGWYITWKEAPFHGPITYSILYTTNPVYIAIGPIHELRGTYTLKKGRGAELFCRLPDQYMIKREDFVRDGEV